VRILFADQYSDFGGAQLGLRDIMVEAKSHGWKSWFVAPGNGAMFDFCADNGFAAQPLPFGSYTNGSKTPGNFARYGFDILRSARLIAQCVRRNRIDLVYVNGPRVLPAAFRVPCPLVFHLQSVLDKKYSRMIAHRTLTRTRGTVIAASEFVGRTLPATGQPTRVIYNGVADVGYFSRPRRAGPVKVAIAGRIAPEKGHLDFLRAAQVLSGRGLDIQFMVVGAALFSDPSYERMVRKAAAGTNVEFRGWTADISAVLHEIDVLAVPSSGVECTPRILLEAYAAGTPIVAYPSGGIPEIVRHGDTGILTAHAGHAALASSIEELIADRDLMARLSANGRYEWETRFRIERFREDIAGEIERRGHEERRQAQAPVAVAGEDYLSRSGAPHR
jgi:glycosyltransferase involved in cell wall biosynthesis